MANGRTVRVTISFLTDFRSRVGSWVPLIAEFDPEAISDFRKRHLAHPGTFTHNALDLAIVDRLDQVLDYAIQITFAQRGEPCDLRCGVGERVETHQGCAP